MLIITWCLCPSRSLRQQQGLPLQQPLPGGPSASHTIPGRDVHHLTHRWRNFALCGDQGIDRTGVRHFEIKNCAHSHRHRFPSSTHIDLRACIQTLSGDTYPTASDARCCSHAASQQRFPSGYVWKGRKYSGLGSTVESCIRSVREASQSFASRRRATSSSHLTPMF